MPSARSLKDKRVVLRSVKDRLRRLNVAVAESDEHSTLWQRAQLSIVAVGGEQQTVERSFERVMEEVERKGAGVVVASDIEWLR